MNYEEFLSQRLGIQEIHFLTNELSFDKKNVQKVFLLIFNKKNPQSWQAAWTCDKLSKRSPELFTKENFWQLIDFLTTNKDKNYQRLCLSILLNLPLYQPIPVEFINLCFEQMISLKEPPAIQALSMKLLNNISKVESDLAYELYVTLENTPEEAYSPAFQSAKRNTIKSLRNRLKINI